MTMTHNQTVELRSDAMKSSGGMAAIMLLYEGVVHGRTRVRLGVSFETHDAKGTPKENAGWEVCIHIADMPLIMPPDEARHFAAILRAYTFKPGEERDDTRAPADIAAGAERMAERAETFNARGISPGIAAFGAEAGSA